MFPLLLQYLDELLPLLANGAVICTPPKYSKPKNGRQGILAAVADPRGQPLRNGAGHGLGVGTPEFGGQKTRRRLALLLLLLVLLELERGSSAQDGMLDQRFGEMGGDGKEGFGSALL